MARRRLPLDANLASAFDNAIEAERQRRTEREREHRAYEKKAAAEAARARVAEAQKETAARAFEKKITQKTFPLLANLVNSVFNQSQRLVARITPDIATGETRLELELQTRDGQYPGSTPRKDHNYWMTATAKGESLYVQSWGYAVDPQYRGYKRTVKPEELSSRISSMIMQYATDAELKKLQRLVRKSKPKENPAPAPAKATPPAEGIVINRPLQFKMPPSNGTP